MDKPIIRINGVRYTMDRLKAGTYRQVLLLGEDYKNYSDQDLIDDMQEIVRVAFGLSKEQINEIDIEQIIPTFRKIQKITQDVFVAKAAEIPNEEGPEASLTGQSSPATKD